MLTCIFYLIPLFLTYRLGTSGIFGSSFESLSPLKGFPTATAAPPRRLSENLDPARRTSCAQCMQNYERELAKLLPKGFEKSSSQIKSEATRSQLPKWLQDAKAHEDESKTINQTQVNSAQIRPPPHLSLFMLSFGWYKTSYIQMNHVVFLIIYRLRTTS